jgi:hypothetical protein
MKRTLVVAVAAVVALAATGFAVAKGLDDGNNKSARALSGTFTATTPSRVETRTCTTADGKTIVSTNGVYTGTASGDADLTGPAKLQARSVINTTDGIGVVTGVLKIDVASGRDTLAHFDGVYSGGQVAGLAIGHAHDPFARLVANVSAGFVAATGFSNGKIGGGTAGGAATELGPGNCRPVKSLQQKSEARGTISAVSSTSITVAGLTCTVPTSLQAKVAGLAVNDRAEIHCTLVGGVNTLVKVEHKGD